MPVLLTFEDVFRFVSLDFRIAEARFVFQPETVRNGQRDEVTCAPEKFVDAQTRLELLQRGPGRSSRECERVAGEPQPYPKHL